MADPTCTYPTSPSPYGISSPPNPLPSRRGAALSVRVVVLATKRVTRSAWISRATSCEHRSDTRSSLRRLAEGRTGW
jgi:hypothetical protein